MSAPGDFGAIAITLTEDHRQVSFATTLESDACADYVEAFRSALLGFGFSPAVVETYLPLWVGK